LSGYHEHCILVQQKLHILLPSQIVSYVNPIIQTCLPEHQHCEHSIRISYLYSVDVGDSFTRCIGSTVLLPMTVALSIGYSSLATIAFTSDFFEVAKLCCVYVQTSRNCLHTQSYPQYNAATYGYSQTVYVQKRSCTVNANLGSWIHGSPGSLRSLISRSIPDPRVY